MIASVLYQYFFFNLYNKYMTERTMKQSTKCLVYGRGPDWRLRAAAGIDAVAEPPGEMERARWI